MLLKSDSSLFLTSSDIFKPHTCHVDTLIRLLLIQNENTKLPRHNGKATKEKNWAKKLRQNLLKFDSIIQNQIQNRLELKK